MASIYERTENQISGGGLPLHESDSCGGAGERLFEKREKEVLRKMLWQVAEFSGGEILTYCCDVKSLPCAAALSGGGGTLSDQELMRRYRVLYPKPTKYQVASARVLERKLAQGGEEAVKIREKLLARMGDVSRSS